MNNGKGGDAVVLDDCWWSPFEYLTGIGMYDTVYDGRIIYICVYIYIYIGRVQRIAK